MLLQELKSFAEEMADNIEIRTRKRHLRSHDSCFKGG